MMSIISRSRGLILRGFSLEGSSLEYLRFLVCFWVFILKRKLMIGEISKEEDRGLKSDGKNIFTYIQVAEYHPGVQDSSSLRIGSEMTPATSSTSFRAAIGPL